MVVFKELIFNSFYLGGSGGLERTDFDQFPLWMGMVVFNELIFHNFYFQRVW